MGSVMPRKKLLKLVREKESNNNNTPAQLALVAGCTLSKEYVPAEKRETNQETKPKKKRRKEKSKKDDSSKEEDE
jgi:hypothetical protein